LSLWQTYCASSIYTQRRIRH